MSKPKRKPEQPRRYRPPLGIEYDEFVGELGPALGDTVTELYVRYGVRDDLYVDWSIELNTRRGSLIDYMAEGKPLARQSRAKVWVANSQIRHVTFGQRGQAVTENVIPLEAGDESVVDEQYDRHLASLERAWLADHGPDLHTTAMFGYANLNRNPHFRNSEYPWLHNTLVAIDSDVVEEIVVERGGAYFGEKDRTAEVWMPAIERMKFFKADPGEVSEGNVQDTDPADRHAALQTTMGMVAAMVNRSEDWPDDFLRGQEDS
ncbi:hypothetical protein ACFWPK_05890 [Nocardia sp. NPDC058519]|uniref:hypothetical protein n=1 Tax=Nocardia sp. NPDC058519 TaxID=3346535 RepID=UPI00364EF75B